MRRRRHEETEVTETTDLKNGATKLTEITEKMQWVWDWSRISP